MRKKRPFEIKEAVYKEILALKLYVSEVPRRLAASPKEADIIGIDVKNQLWNITKKIYALQGDDPYGKDLKDIRLLISLTQDLLAEPIVWGIICRHRNKVGWKMWFEPKLTNTYKALYDLGCEMSPRIQVSTSTVNANLSTFAEFKNYVSGRKQGLTGILDSKPLTNEGAIRGISQLIEMVDAATCELEALLNAEDNKKLTDQCKNSLGNTMNVLADHLDKIVQWKDRDATLKDKAELNSVLCKVVEAFPVMTNETAINTMNDSGKRALLKTTVNGLNGPSTGASLSSSPPSRGGMDPS